MVRYHFADLLAQVLKTEKLTAKQLCAKINNDEDGATVSEASMSNWLNDPSILPSGDRLLAVCKALNVTPDYLLGYTDVPNYQVADAKILKQAAAYTGLPRQALEALHHNAAYPFIAPSENIAVEGFKSLDTNRTAVEVARLLAQPDFLRALETMETARQYHQAMKSIDGQGLDADEARHTAETNYLYLKDIITSRITACIDAILEQD